MQHVEERARNLSPRAAAPKLSYASRRAVNSCRPVVSRRQKARIFELLKMRS